MVAPARAIIAGTDPGTVVSAHGEDLRVAGNFHRAAAARATANSGTLISAVGGHIGMVGNADGFAYAVVTAADAGTAGV